MSEKLFSCTKEPQTEIEYEVRNLRDDLGAKAPDKNMIYMRLWVDNDWREACFDRELALDVAAELTRLAVTL